MYRLARPALFCAALLACAAGAARAQPYDFTVPPVDNVQDLHGNPSGAQLVVFAAGNQFMVMDALVAAFEKSNPNVRRVFFETLPPGIVAAQIAAGAIRVGNLVIAVRPDVLLSGVRRMAALRRQGVVGPAFAYATNVLAIMVREGNPKHVESLRDLGRADVRVAMPNPAWEGVAVQIEAAYRKAGGDALASRIMVDKVSRGTTLLTRIHHRQTPLFILDGRADAGPVWRSEALYQERLGEPIAMVSIPWRDNVRATYEAAAIVKAPHPSAAQAFLTFLRSPTARGIYRSYGFGAIAQRRKR